MSLHWNLRDLDPDAVSGVSRDTGLSTTTARLIVARGHHRGVRGEGSPPLERFLEGSLHALLDPMGLPDMPKAVQRIRDAIDRGETILVHGDYDVDGLCGTAILMRLFRHLGAKAEWHVPNRLVDGYSFGDHSVRRAEKEGATLVISVDNGTSAGETITALKERGIDTLVTDHHEPPLGDLPPACALVNPKLEGSTYPFRELCGSGVAFKLAWAVCQEISGARRVREDLRSFLLSGMGYVALATVCDVVPLLDENRILCRYGLEALGNAPTPGLDALLGVADLRGRALCGEDVGFQIGPRLNAAGRLGQATEALELLITDDPERARELARELDRMNQERRSIEKDVLAEALEAAAPFEDPELHPVLVLAGQGWHQGVVGIVAARLTERFARPALVIGLDGDEGRGSARSVDGFSVLDAMHGGAEHMQRYGGHAAAAGCEVRADAIDVLRASICARARTLLAEGALPEAALDVDAELPLREMTPQLMAEIDRLEPFGQDNEAPVLVSRDVRLAEPARIVGKDSTHLMLSVRDGMHRMRGMFFGAADRIRELEMGKPFDLAFTPRWNTFRGETNLELRVHDFRAN